MDELKDVAIEVVRDIEGNWEEQQEREMEEWVEMDYYSDMRDEGYFQ